MSPFNKSRSKQRFMFLIISALVINDYTLHVTAFVLLLSLHIANLLCYQELNWIITQCKCCFQLNETFGRKCRVLFVSPNLLNTLLGTFRLNFRVPKLRTLTQSVDSNEPAWPLIPDPPDVSLSVEVSLLKYHCREESLGGTLSVVELVANLTSSEFEPTAQRLLSRSKSGEIE